METTEDGTFFEEGDQVRLKLTGETGRINASAGGVVYVLMDNTNESRLFAAYIDEDAAIELFVEEDARDDQNTTPFSAQQSERWLLERTYHARLRDGRELSVPNLTLAMTQLIDFFVPLSSRSAKSRLPERPPSQTSSPFSVPLPTWREISAEEAAALSRTGSPILFFGEHTWEHPKEAMETWRLNRNMRAIIYGDAWKEPEAISGSEYAVCYLDPKRGTFSNAAWRSWFPSDATTLLDGLAHDPITFLAPCVQFPYTTHYTVVTADGHISAYANQAGAIEGFQALPAQEEGNLYAVFPQFSYYHEVTCLDGVYRLEFFGSRMDERGYRVKGAAENGGEQAL